MDKAVETREEQIKHSKIRRNPNIPAWESGQGSFLGKFFATTGQLLATPNLAFRHPEFNYTKSLTYGLTASILSALLSLALIGSFIAYLGYFDEDYITSIVSIAASPINCIFATFVGAALLHFCLYLTGGVGASFNSTVRGMGYISGLVVFVANLIIPVTSIVVAAAIILNIPALYTTILPIVAIALSIYLLIVKIVIIKTIHFISFGKVFLAIITPLLLLILLAFMFRACA